MAGKRIYIVIKKKIMCQKTGPNTDTCGMPKVILNLQLRYAVRENVKDSGPEVWPEELKLSFQSAEKFLVFHLAAARTAVGPWN